MSIYTIKMPDIGEGIAEVEVVAWHVKPGDAVREDQPLADVMTDKASVEIPSPVDGTVRSLGGAVGDVLAVGAALVHIEVAETAGAAASLERAQAADVVSARAAAAEPAPIPRPAAIAASQPMDDGVQDRPIASPAVRRRAWELDVDLHEVHGSGPGGRIMHGDLELHAAKQGRTPRSVPSSKLPAGAGGPTTMPSGDTEAIPVIGVRRKIAQRMQESKRRIPHFSYVEEIDVTELESLRAQLNARRGASRGKLTLLPFLVRAMALAAQDCPQVNARFDDEAGVVTRHRAMHLGIATQTDAGLMVPVLRHAETHDLWSAAREIARLAQAAREGHVTRDELSGSTITLTSLGALGGIASTPVINRPEVAIVGVNRIVERPAFRQGVVVPRLAMNLSSSFDHRVVDGADAARFVQAIRGALEAPATLFIE